MPVCHRLSQSVHRLSQSVHRFQLDVRTRVGDSSQIARKWYRPPFAAPQRVSERVCVTDSVGYCSTLSCFLPPLPCFIVRLFCDNCLYNYFLCSLTFLRVSSFVFFCPSDRLSCSRVRDELSRVSRWRARTHVCSRSVHTLALEACSIDPLRALRPPSQPPFSPFTPPSPSALLTPLCSPPAIAPLLPNPPAPTPSPSLPPAQTRTLLITLTLTLTHQSG